MLGTMLWFNLDKDLGVITTAADGRFEVRGEAFAGGVRPKLRCAGTVVEFRAVELDGRNAAEDVAFVPEVAPRRARRRHGHGRW